MNLIAIFLTGLTVGGLTCLAVQGGLLTSVITANENDELKKGENSKNTIRPTFAFLLSKLTVHTVFGFILGSFGGLLGINQTAQIIMQFLAGVYMVAVALNLLNVHPVFRYVVIQPPRFLTRRVKNQSKSKNTFAPAILGAMTIFIPCGTTLAMEALAISSGNGPMGATIMGVFVLGTMPLFFGIGWITSMMGDNFRSSFLKIAAFVILYLGITSMQGALVASGSPINLKSIIDNYSSGGVDSNKVQTTQNVDINITSSGYSPNYIRVKKGLPVTINLVSKDAYSCASAFRIPSFGIERNLQPNETQKVSFTPTSVGKITFTCSMGMYSGIIEVI